MIITLPSIPGVTINIHLLYITLILPYTAINPSENPGG